MKDPKRCDLHHTFSGAQVSLGGLRRSFAAGLQKINVTADVQTGKNVLGAGGAGVYVFFNDYVSLLVGPVFFTDKTLQPGHAGHLWTTQLDIDIPLGKSAKK